jgi:hypothetical protein
VAAVLGTTTVGFYLNETGQPPSLYYNNEQVSTEEDFNTGKGNVTLVFTASPPRLRIEFSGGGFEVLVGQGWLGVTVNTAAAQTAVCNFFLVMFFGFFFFFWLRILVFFLAVCFNFGLLFI